MPVYCDFVVVHDPDEFGYRPGARFCPEEIEQMIFRDAITTGTVFRVTNYCPRLRCSQGKYIYQNKSLVRIRGSQ